MKIKLLMFCCILGLGNLKIKAQGKEQLRVLKNAEIGRTHIFGAWTADNDGETHLKYLGQFRAANGKIYKIMTSVWLWGLSKRATNRILIFDQENHYLGNYKITMLDDLPFKMEQGKLRFKNTYECKDRSSFVIDLRPGIPNKIFIKCTKEVGDEYLFESTT